MTLYKEAKLPQIRYAVPEWKDAIKNEYNRAKYVKYKD